MSTSSHFDDSGRVHLVDVTAKPPTERVAVARASILMLPATGERIRLGQFDKGDVLGVARLAAIGATKLTSHIIPLCHAIPIEAVQVDFAWIESASTDPSLPKGREVLECHVTVKTTAKTGVEMEAMTAAAVACLTVYDMTKSIDREMTIGPIELVEKRGGKSGTFVRGE